MNKNKKIYIVIAVLVLFVSVLGSTYAYISANVKSPENSVTAGSTTYSISMDIIPIYNDFRVIPMNDDDVIKALKNNCKDKYNHGACSAYKININGYDDKLMGIKGKMNVTLSNMINLSYMVLEEKEEAIDEDSCVTIDEIIYCKATEPNLVVEGEELDLGDYSIKNTTEKNFLLALWLTNLEESQNDYDLGDYNASITFTLGEGGAIKGNIASSIGHENELQGRSGE